MKNAALFIVATFAGLLLMELGFRIVEHEFTLQNFVAREMDNVKDDRSIVQYDPVLGWAMREGFYAGASGPGKNLTIGKYGVRLNSSKNVAPQAAAAVVVVGDSFAAGSEVDDNESIPAILEQLLKRPVVNGAVGAYGVDQIVLRAEELNRKLQPEEILMVVISQDIVRNGYSVYGGGSKPYFVVEHGQLVEKNSPPLRVAASPHFSPRLGYSYLVHRIMMWWDPTRWLGGDRFVKIYGDKEAVLSSCKLMERAAKLPKIKLILIYGGDELSLPKLPYVQPVIDCAKSAGIEVLDFWEDFRSRDYEPLYFPYGKLHGHFTQQGNKHVAQKIAQRFFAK